MLRGLWNTRAAEVFRERIGDFDPAHTVVDLHI
jgi:hypothetical protein